MKFRLSLLACAVILCGMANTKPIEILLWPNGAPGSETKTDEEKTRITDQGDSNACSAERSVGFQGDGHRCFSLQYAE